MNRMKYTYQVVQGCGLHGIEKHSLPKAVASLQFLRLTVPNAEIERRGLLPNGASRYWRWRGGRWRLWDLSDPSIKDLAHWDAKVKL